MSSERSPLRPDRQHRKLANLVDCLIHMNRASSPWMTDKNLAPLGPVGVWSLHCTTSSEHMSLGENSACRRQPPHTALRQADGCVLRQLLRRRVIAIEFIEAHVVWPHKVFGTLPTRGCNAKSDGLTSKHLRRIFWHLKGAQTQSVAHSVIRFACDSGRPPTDCSRPMADQRFRRRGPRFLPTQDNEKRKHTSKRS
jgi:hypothetical protein